MNAFYGGTRPERIFRDAKLGKHVAVDWWRACSRGRRSVRISDDALKNVVFIGYAKCPLPDNCSEDELPEIEKSIHWGGTGFLVTVNCGNSAFPYLVTAKHVADQVEGGSCIIRLNFRGGGPALFRADLDAKWWRHPETPESVDAAVLPWMPDRDIADYSLLQAEDWFLTDKIIEKRQIGPGDNVFAVGLFSLATGRQRNIPIVRTGNIAMMSKEKIPGIRIGEWRGEAEVYLIEARSLGGFSGSPVFVRGTVHIPFNTDAERKK